MAAGQTLTLSTGSDYIFGKTEVWTGVIGNGTRGVTLQTMGNTLYVSRLDHITGGINPPGSAVKDVIVMQPYNGGNTVSVRLVETVYGAVGGKDVLMVATTGATMAVENVETFLGSTSGTNLITLTSTAGNTMSVGYLKSIVGGTGKDLITFGAAGEFGTTAVVTMVETLIGTSSGQDIIATVAGGGNTVQVNGIEVFLGNASKPGDTITLGSGGGTIGVSFIETLIGSGNRDVMTYGYKIGSIDLRSGGGTVAVSSIETIVGGTGSKNTAILLDVGNTITVASLNTLIGGGGNDVVTMTIRDGTPIVGTTPIAWNTAGATMLVSQLETIIGTSQADAIVALNNENATMRVSAVETLVGRQGIETVFLGTGGNTVSIEGLETLVGSTGTDVVGVTAGGSTSGMTVAVSAVETLIGGAGTDVVIFDQPAGTVYVSGIETVYVGGQAMELSGADRALVFPVAVSAPSAPILSSVSDTGVLGDSKTSTALPTLTGTAAAGSVVVLYGNGAQLGTGTADGAGQWAITANTVLADGVWTMTAKTVSSGMESDASSTLLLTIDSTAPSAPSSLALTPATDTGPSATDGITSLAAPTVTGSAAAGSVVMLYDGDALLGAATAGGLGAWSFTPTLTGGSHTLTARAVDDAGNTSAATAGFVVTIDSTATAPAGLALAPASDSGTPGDQLTSVNTPTVTGTAEAFAIVTLHEGAAVLASATADASGVWQITPGALGDGAHTLTAGSVDRAGNSSGPSSGFTVTIDTTPPTAPSAPSLTAASDSGVSSSDRLTNDGTPTFTGTAEAGAIVDLLVAGGGVVGTATADGSGAWTITAATVADGERTFSTRARDLAGNTRDGTATLLVTIDTQAPAVPTSVRLTAASDSGLSATDGVTNLVAPTVTGSAAAGSTVSLYDGGVLQGAVTANAQGAWEFTSPTLATGAHTLTAQAVDAAGNSSAPSAAFVVSVDLSASAPTALALTPDSDTGVAGDAVTSRSTPSVTGLAEASGLVSLYEGGRLLGQTTAGVDGAWTITSSALDGGTHSLTARMVDAAGNTSGSSTGFTITIDAVAPAAPTSLALDGASDSGTAGDRRTRVTSPTITGTAEAGSTVALYDGATLVGLTTADAGTGAWSVTTATLPEGTRTLTARATDLAGNTGAASAALSVTIDTASAAPASLTLAAGSDSGISAADRLTNDATPTVTGSAEAGAVVSLYDGAGLLGTGTANGAGLWSVTSSVLAEGTHTLTASALDVAGNSSAASGELVVEIDVTAPGLSGLNGDGDQIAPTVTGTAEAGSVITLYESPADGAGLFGVATAAGDGSWSITTPELAGGTYTLTARATDAAGNESPAAELTVVVTGRPGIPGALALAPETDSGIAGDLTTNITSPVLTGTALADGEVTLYDGAVAIGTSTADYSGHWTIAFDGSLTDGSHFLRARVLDGTATLTSSTLTLTIDTTAPDAPAPLLSAASDSGRSAGDGITNVATPTITGSAEAGSVVTLYADDGVTPIGTATADGNGAWSLGTDTLGEGGHTLTAMTVDAAGNSSAASATLTLTIDSTASVPGGLTLASDSGVAGDDITNAPAPTVTGTAEPGGTISLYRGADLVGTGTVGDDGGWTVTAAALGGGTHGLTATLVDIAGNSSGASAALTVTIDASAPDAPGALAFAAGADTGRSDSDRITSAVTQTVTGTAEDGSTVLLYDGASVIGTAVATGGAWTITTGTLAEGDHALTARAVDVAGNTGAASAALSITIDTSTADPGGLLLAAASDSGLSATDRITSATTLSLTGMAEANSTVTLYGDGVTPIGTVTADGTGAWSFTGTGFAEGVHTITATAVDVAGNSSAGAGTLVVTVDQTIADPDAPVLAPASDTGVAGDWLTSLLAPAITGTTEAGALVSLYDGGSFVGSGTADGAGVWSISALLGEGQHTLSVRALDLAGNTSGLSSSLAVTIDAMAPAAPTAPLLGAASDSGLSDSDRLTFVNTPLVTGTAEANSTVLLYNGGSVAGTATADGAGAWTITTASLSDGAHALTARSVDAAGNTSGASGALLLTIDTVTPEPSGVGLTSATDTGRSAHDGVTRVTAPVVTGTAEAGSVVSLYEDAVLLGVATASGLGLWSIASPTLTEAAHTLTAVAVDEAGNTAIAADVFTITVDLSVSAPTAPVLDLASDTGLAGDSSTSGDRLTNDATPTLTGTAEAFALVEIYKGASVVGMGTADASGLWSATAGALINGEHTLVAQAIDLAGNSSGVSAELTVTIDTVNLDVSDLALAAGSDTGVSDSDGLTRIAIPVITGTAEALSVVTLYDGGAGVGTATAGADGGFTLTTSALAAGTHTLLAISLDRAGNTSETAGTLTVSIDLSTPQPSLSMAAVSDSGVSNSDHVTKITQPYFSGTAEANSTVTLYDGAVALATIDVGPTGTWGILSTAMADGTYSVTAVAVDQAGNTSTPSTTLTVTIDTVAAVPSLSLSAASDSGTTGDGITNDATPDITGTTEAGGFVSLYEGATLRGTATADLSGRWTITSSRLGNGPHTLTALGTDAAGNTSAASGPLAVTIDTVAPNAATSVALAAGSDTGSSTTDRLTNAATPSLTGSAEAGSTVVLYDGDTAVGTALADGSGRWTVTAGGTLADGQHSLKVTVTDIAGNTGAASSPLSVTIDTVTPAPGTLALTTASDSGRSSTDAITNLATPTITGTAEANSTVTLYEGVVVRGTTTVNGLGVWSVSTPTLAAGTHSLTAVAVDRAGNTSAASTALTVTIDVAATAPGALALLVDSGASSSDRLINTGTPTITGTAEANGLVQLYDGANLVGVATADGAGQWSITSSGLGAGTHGLTARLIDVAGNTSAASSALSITIDTTAPAAPGTPVLAAASDSGRLSTDRITTVTTPTVTGSAEAGSTVVLYDGGTAVGTAVAGGTGAWTITSSALAGSATGTPHSLSAVAMDAAGNSSSASSALTVTIDTSAAVPTDLSLAAASDTAIVGDRITSATEPVISGRAEAGSVVTLFEGVDSLGSATADGAGVWSITSTTLTGGTGTAHTLFATIVDTAGNTSVASADLTLTIDTVADDVSVELASGSDDGASTSDRITSVTTPTLTGKAGNSRPVVVSDGATVLGTVTADGSGNWTFTTGTLSEGVHNIGIVSQDTAGNPGTGGVTVTIDLTGTAPGDLALAAGSDSGRDTADGRTKLTSPTITGTAEAGSTVRLFDNGLVVGTVTASGLGTWAFTTPSLGEGAHSLTATAVDVTGNSSDPSAALVVTIDLTAASPTGLALGGDSDSGVTGDDTTNITTPAITGMSEAGDLVMLYDGDDLVGVGTAGLSGAWSIQASGLDAGQRTLTARSIDVAGNTSAASGPLLLTIDTTAPAAPAFGLAAGSDSGALADDLLTNATTPTVSGTAEANSVVTLYEGAALKGTTTADGSGAWTITSTVLGAGPHSLFVQATDAAGNTSAASDDLVVTIDVSSATPSDLELNGDDDSGSSDSDGITSVPTPTIVGKSEANAVVILHAGSDVIGTATADGAGIWSATVGTALADGTYSVTATALDAAGNTSAASSGFLLTIDTAVDAQAAPVLTAGSDTGHSSADRLTNTVSPVLTGTAEANSTVTLYDGGLFVGVGTADGDGAWTITSGALSEGERTLTVVAVDMAGNSSEASAGLVVTIDVTAEPPSMLLAPESDTGFENDDLLTSDTTPTVTGTAEAGSLVTLYDSGVSKGTALADGNGAWTITSAVLGDGVHQLSATAVDIAGNTAAAISGLTVTVDTTPPAAPTGPALSADSDSGDPGNGLTNVRAPTLQGKAEQDTRILLYDGATFVGATTTDLYGDWAGSTSDLALGTHTLTARAVDAAGNTSSASGSLTVTIMAEIGAPTGLALAPSSDTGVTNDGRTNQTSPSIIGSAAASSTVTLYVGAMGIGTAIGTAVADGGGLWTIATGSLLGAPQTLGMVTLTAKAMDADGVESPQSTPFTITIDTVAPVAPTELDLATDSGTDGGDGLTNLATPAITGTAEAGSTIVLYEGGTARGTAQADGGGHWSLASGSLADGTRSLTARSIDAAGNTSPASTVLTITIDTAVAPPAGLDLTTDSGLDGADDRTNIASPVITGTAEAGSLVLLYDGATALGTATADTVTGFWTVTSASLADGVHSLIATAVDPAGNTSTASDALAVTIDTAAALAAGLDLTTDSGLSGTDDWTNVTSPVITGTAEAGSLVLLYDGATALGTATADAVTGFWTVTSASLADGVHSLTAMAVDPAGNTSAASAALAVTIDTTAPQLAVETLRVNRNTLTLTFNELVTVPAAPNQATGMSVMVDGSPRTVSAVAGTGTSTLTLTLASAVSHGQLVTFSYDPAVTDSALLDGAGNEMAVLASQEIVNSTLSPPPPPPPPTSTETVDGVTVGKGTQTNGDGSTSTVITIPVVTPGRAESVGGNTVADIPLVTSGGASLLNAQVPTGIGLTVSGTSAPKTAGSSLTDLIREIQAHTEAGSTSQAQLTGGGSGFLSGLPADTPLLVQTIVPTMAAGSTASAEPLVITGTPAAAGNPYTALVIDTRGLPSGTVIQLQNVEFAAVIGAVRVTGGEGSQNVWGDGEAQYIVLGADDDTLHGGGGNDYVGSRTGNDILYGDEGADTVTGGEDGDIVYGNQQDDMVYGNQGSDTLFGGQHQDSLFGGQDGDIAYGNKGEDVVYGNTGGDTLFGGQGDDTLFGGQGHDWLFGNIGDDVLVGGVGADTLTGGEGADRFVFKAGGGDDVVTDFRFADGDRLIDDGRQWTVRDGGDGAVVTFLSGDTVTLRNLRADQVTAGIFTAP